MLREVLPVYYKLTLQESDLGLKKSKSCHHWLISQYMQPILLLSSINWNTELTFGNLLFLHRSTLECIQDRSLHKFILAYCGTKMFQWISSFILLSLNKRIIWIKPGSKPAKLHALPCKSSQYSLYTGCQYNNHLFLSSSVFISGHYIQGSQAIFSLSALCTNFYSPRARFQPRSRIL